MPPLSKRIEKFEREHTKRKPQNLKWLRYIDVQDMLEQLDIDNISRATFDEIVFSCPFPGHSHGDEKPSCYMNDGSKKPELTTVFKCHGCGRAGNAVTFYSEYQNISRQRASLELKEHYAPGYRKPKYGSIQKEFDERRRLLEQPAQEQSLQIIAPDLYKPFKVDWENLAGEYDSPDIAYMFKRGFSWEDLTEWDIGYDHYSDRITIPVFDADRNLVGVKARAWQPERKPKYLILGDREDRPARYGFSPYEKSLVVFGIHRWGVQKQFVFVEGEIDVMSLWKMNIPAICTGGASMSSTQAQIIKDHCDEIVLFLDDDLAGSHAVRGFDKEDGEHKPGIIEIMEPFVRVKVVGRHKYDANDYLRNGKHRRLRKLIDEATPSFHLRLSSAG